MKRAEKREDHAMFCIELILADNFVIALHHFGLNSMLMMEKTEKVSDCSDDLSCSSAAQVIIPNETGPSICDQHHATLSVCVRSYIMEVDS
jgi:hypothetical protein